MLRTTYLAVGLASMCWATTMAATANGDRPMALDPAAAARFAGLALKCLHAEYPNHISHTMDGDADVRPPHVLNPAFYGCFDWHSDVHGHWLLVRLVRAFPDAPFAPEARAELARSLTAENIAGEVAYLQHAHRADSTWLPPAEMSDRADPKLAHIDGLNLSRAWMLEGIAHGLEARDRRVAVLRALAARHGQAALPAVTGEHYKGG